MPSAGGAAPDRLSDTTATATSSSSPRMGQSFDAALVVGHGHALQAGDAAVQSFSGSCPQFISEARQRLCSMSPDGFCARWRCTYPTTFFMWA